MKISEVIGPAAPLIQPTIVKQQQRVNALVQQMAVADQQQQQPTAEDQRLAQNKFNALKREIDAQYVQQAEQELIKNVVKPNTRKEAGREKR